MASKMSATIHSAEKDSRTEEWIELAMRRSSWEHMSKSKTFSEKTNATPSARNNNTEDDNDDGSRDMLEMEAQRKRGQTLSHNDNY